MKVLSAEVKGLCSAAATALFTVIYSPDPLHSFSHGIKIDSNEEGQCKRKGGIL